MRTHLIAALSVAGIAVAAAGPTGARVLDSTQERAPAGRLTLGRLVAPDARVEVQGRLVRFALHGLIYFDTLAELFAFVDGEAGRWQFESAAARQAFADDLMRRGVESRVVSMEAELPLELLLTHTRAEVEAAVAGVTTGDAPLVFKGRHWQLTAAAYRDAFLRVRDRWATSLNCWSASPSIPGRVLSNWYLIDEGIELFGATYDSTEHFWQAVKFHPDVTVGDLRTLLTAMLAVDWRPWLAALAADQRFYFANALRRRVPEAESRARAPRVVPGRAGPASRARRSGADAPAADRPRAGRRRPPSRRSTRRCCGAISPTCST